MKTLAANSVLAADGGSPIRTEPFPPWPYYSPAEIEAVAEVLRSGGVNYHTGENGKRFESEFAESVGVRRAISLMNGTVALELALYTLGIGPGDEVIVPCRTFIATASCAVMRGATPVFADIDSDSQNITAAAIRRAITPRSKAIIIVHLAGWPCEMDEIVDLAREFNLKLIEDCAQAQGALFKGKPVGSFGDMAAFSFCQDKIITTGGEGGMLVTDSEVLWERAWSFKDHGKSYDAVYLRQHPPGFRWLHESFGTNWRMTELQATIGRLQLRNLENSVAARNRHAAALTRGLKHAKALRLTEPPTHLRHAYYKYYAFVRPELLREGWTRDRVQTAIAAEGIPCIVGGCGEIYLEKAVPAQLRPKDRLEKAAALSETALMFQVYPTLKDRDIDDTCAAVMKVMDAASR